MKEKKPFQASIFNSGFRIMSKHSDNPFSSLKASNYPDARKKAVRASLGEERKEKKTSADEDMELFLTAMSRVEKLPSEAGRKSSPSSKHKAASGSRPHQDTKTVASSTPGISGTEKKSSSVEALPTETSDEASFPFADMADTWQKRKTLSASSSSAADTEKTRPEKKEPPQAVSTASGHQSDSDDEEDTRDFLSAMKGITPLEGKGRAVTPDPASPETPYVAPSNPLQDIVEGKVEFALSGTDEFMEGHVVGLDLLTVGKLQAGQLSPEAHIDLHGLNSEQAFHNLVGFFRNAYYKGVRTALVVTGRGLNSPDGNPVLRAKMRHWLTQEPFRRIVLAFCTARREDGGTGALYVLLRKYRKNSGKVYWDALPEDPDLFI